jgi:hypothetical protein
MNEIDETSTSTIPTSIIIQLYAKSVVDDKIKKKRKKETTTISLISI